MSKYLHPKARETIGRILDQKGEITMDEAVEIVEPHMDYDMQELVKQKTKQVVRGIMKTRKDNSGTRTCFATKRNDTESVYIDIDNCNTLQDIQVVEKQLYEKIRGLRRSHDKATNRCKVLEGQIEMDLKEVEGK